MADPDSTPASPAAKNFALVERWSAPISTGSTQSVLSTLSNMRRLFHRAAEAPQPGPLLLDVSHCSTIDPGGILLVMYTGARLSKLGWTPYLRSIGPVQKFIMKHLTHYLLPKDRRKEASPSRGEYLMRGIDKRAEMIEELEAWGHGLKESANASDEAVALWQMQIGEVTTNCFQHGGPHTQEGTLVAGAQRPRRKSVQLAALDFGSGIPASIRPVAEAANLTLNDGELIAYACIEGVTARSVPENQGRGLATLVRTLARNPEGRLLILSGNGVFYFNGKEQRTMVLDADAAYGLTFEGTLTVITLRT